MKWMEYLSGFRNFIETGELEQLKILSEQNPDYLYYILPYASVFGLSEIYSEKLEKLNVDMPSWFGGMGGYSKFRYQALKNFNQDFRCINVDNSRGSGRHHSSGGSSGGSFGGFGGGSW